MKQRIALGLLALLVLPVTLSCSTWRGDALTASRPAPTLLPSPPPRASVAAPTDPANAVIIFIVVTPPPNTPAETNSQNAARARAWANWLTSPEFLGGHPNVFTFDFFALLAESNAHARDYNMLRAAYRPSDAHDSHPNERAHREIAPRFADFIAQAIKTHTGK